MGALSRSWWWRFERCDEKLLALYSREMSTRDIEAHLRELYGCRWEVT
jgi:transposase-like protein